ncbi:MAG: cupin domain-containing protein [Firmicutes bacterium]|nr:cupin domain-containing protein [Bacillota bacterium]
MKKYLIVIMAFILGTAVGLTAPIAEHLIDSTPKEGVLINIDQFFKENPAKSPVQFNTVFSSPRCVVNLARISGPFIDRHIHTDVDEIVYVIKGKGEVYLNGKWVEMKAGDLHVCPRGVAHTTRAIDKAGFEAISIFAPPAPAAGDKVMID